MKLRPLIRRQSRSARSALIVVGLLASASWGCGSREALIIGENDFRLERRDEFDGPELDLDYWELASHTFEPNLAWFSPANARIDDGHLVLSITADAAPANPLPNEVPKPYSAAEVRTRVSFLYGRFRARVRFASGLVAAKLTAALAITAGGVAATWTYVNHQRQIAVATPAPVRAKPTATPQAPVAPEVAAPAIISPEDVKLEEDAPAVKAPRTVARAARPETTDKAEPTPADLEAEMKLIRGADSALRAGRASEALTLLAQHQAEHPHAALAHEREGLRAIANCQIGAAGSAAAAERFLSRAPHSPLAPRLRSACRITE